MLRVQDVYHTLAHYSPRDRQANEEDHKAGPEVNEYRNTAGIRRILGLVKDQQGRTNDWKCQCTGRKGRSNHAGICRPRGAHSDVHSAKVPATVSQVGSGSEVASLA